MRFDRVPEERWTEVHNIVQEAVINTILKKKKVGKTTGPFRYDLNQISYDYTVEVTNRLKG